MNLLYADCCYFLINKTVVEKRDEKNRERKQERVVLSAGGDENESVWSRRQMIEEEKVAVATRREAIRVWKFSQEIAFVVVVVSEWVSGALGNCHETSSECVCWRVSSCWDLWCDVSTGMKDGQASERAGWLAEWNECRGGAGRGGQNVGEWTAAHAEWNEWGVLIGDGPIAVRADLFVQCSVFLWVCVIVVISRVSSCLSLSHTSVIVCFLFLLSCKKKHHHDQ